MSDFWRIQVVKWCSILEKQKVSKRTMLRDLFDKIRDVQMDRTWIDRMPLSLIQKSSTEKSYVKNLFYN